MKQKELIVAGLDIGSVSTKAVLLDSAFNRRGSALIETGARARIAVEKCFQMALDRAHISAHDVSYIVSTGYGRKSVSFSNEDITEISCHAQGIHFLFPNTNIIIDVGGQDSKAIKINEKGRLLSFVMNDKCSAGTGRFMEVMARALQVSIEEFGTISLQAQKVVPISSFCTVFAESEVISRIAEEKPVADIIKGIHLSIASKVIKLAEKVGLEGEVALTGGVAKNRGFVKEIEELLGRRVNIPDEPQLSGALGAALRALEKHKSANS